MDSVTLRTRLISLIIESGDDDINEKQFLAMNGSLRSLNYSSLSLMRLVDAIENDLGVYLNLETDTELVENLDTLTTLVQRKLESSSA